MTVSLTLSRYFGLRFLGGIGMVFGALGLLGALIDFVELLNRSIEREGVSFGTVLAMSALKMPLLAEKILPFAVLFGAMWAFMRLTRSQELVVARAAGLSVWQFTAPALALAALLGVFVITVYNPVAATMASHFEELESRYLRGRTATFSIFKTGIWLRQADENGQSVIHALRVSGQGLRLEEVIVWLYHGNDELIGRLDASSAVLEAGAWKLDNVWETRPDRPRAWHATFSVGTTMTEAEIQDSFATPDTISFWDLPRFIATAEAAGFSATRHLLHFYSLLALPFLLCAMVVIAASFSLRLARLGGVVQLLFFGTLTGFILYFLTDVTQALGLSQNLPVPLAAWAPAGVALFLGVTALLHLEDG